jgi:glycerophosphoryl diester phosphodiesterase
MTHPFLDHPRPIAFAHRGGALEAEENTQAAFAHAERLGYSHIETDVQATRDGVAVIFHDPTLERMAGRPERIDQMDWAALKAVRTHGGNAIPRLDATLAGFAGLFFNLEAKADAAVAPIAEAVRRTDALRRICAGSFELHRTRRLREMLGPELCWSPARRDVAAMWLASLGLPMPRPHYQALQIPPRYGRIPLATARMVRAARARGVQVHVWTVDDEDEMERLIDAGVDGLMTDRPSVLKEVLVRRGLWRG